MGRPSLFDRNRIPKAHSVSRIAPDTPGSVRRCAEIPEFRMQRDDPRLMLA